MTTQVDWGDGSGDKITLTYAASEGDQTVTVSSDANTGSFPRQKVINFTVTAGQTTITRPLTVVQEAGAGDIIIITRNDVYTTYNEVAVGYEQ